MTGIDGAMRPWLERIVQQTGPLELYDAHTHIGSNDPDGYTQTTAELLGALAPARRALGAGARGIKLHPRAERFGMEEPVVAELVALAHERRVPVLIHAGRGIPALGRNTVRLAERNPGATLILAHAAISDLAWLWRVLPEHPNVLVDTAWWNPVDLVALFALAPPVNIVWASDSPYGRPVASAVMALRC